MVVGSDTCHKIDAPIHCWVALKKLVWRPQIVDQDKNLRGIATKIPAALVRKGADGSGGDVTVVVALADLAPMAIRVG